jgi:GWxTD domain-containing protein
LALAVLLAVGPAAAQDALDAGREAHDRARLAEAEALFRAAFAADPTARDEEGSAAYWLGRTYLAQGRRAQALQVWRAGTVASLRAAAPDVASADAFLRAVVEDTVADEALQTEAVGVYLYLLTLDASALGPEERRIVLRHRALAEAVAPPGVEAEGLAEWWRAQDPLPATDVNERVVEHLERVAAARRAYPDARRATGLDDRGLVSVRLGDPDFIRRVDFFTPRMLRRIDALRRAAENNLLVTPSDFNDAELWLYDEGEPYYYLFVDQGGGFRVGGAVDLIPQQLRTGVTEDTGRGGAKGDILLVALHEIYEQLAPYHLDFGTRYNRMAGYLARMEDLERQYETLTGSSQLYSPGKRSDWSELMTQGGMAGVAGLMPDAPAAVVRQMMAEDRRADEVASYQRAQRVPRAASEVLDGVVPLHVAARLARFLDPDGTTRTVVYWAASAAAGDDLSGLPDDLGLAFTLVRQADGHVEADEVRAAYAADGLRTPQAMLLPPTWPASLGATGRFHIRMQWDLCEADGTSCFRTTVAEADSLAALEVRPGHLTASDLVPVLAQEGDDGLGEPQLTPYPYAKVGPGTELGLYFEVYGLTYGTNDYTSYSIRAEVARRRDGRFLRRGSTDRVAIETLSTSEGRTAREHVLLDRALWEGADEVEVTITITDENTGYDVSRTIVLEVDDA